MACAGKHQLSYYNFSTIKPAVYKVRYTGWGFFRFGKDNKQIATVLPLAKCQPLEPRCIHHYIYRIIELFIVEKTFQIMYK